jgi:predicted ATPase
MLLRTLGGLALEGTEFTRPKPLALMAYLALEGPQDRRYVAELFWPSARDHMKSLTVALTRLRQGAQGAVEADRQRVWTTALTDAEQLLACLERGEVASALELYRGPFLNGFYPRHQEVELEEWVYKTREFLAGRVQGAALELAEQEAARGRYADASKKAEVAFTLRGSVLEPEQLGRLHTLMCAGGSPYEAELREEADALGIELVPSSDAARRVLSQPVAGPSPNNLPTRGTTFVGRDLELTEVGTLLAQPTCRLLTLVGPAGVGKTRLGLQFAQEQLSQASFQDGIYLVSLAPLAAASLLPTAVAEVLGLELTGSEDALRQVSAYIGDKEILLLLDSFEHLMDGAIRVSELVTTCPNLKVLVTSRERLNLEEEHIFSVEGLPYPDDDGLTSKEALRFDAVTLFVRRAQRARPDFVLTEETLPGVLRICRLVEGLPLGLELAAVWVRAMACHDIAQEIGTTLNLLATPTRNLPERHQNLRSAFEHSWKLLSAREQEVLRKLSVFRGGFRHKAASEVTGATLPILASLVDKSFLRIDSTGRYDRHPLLYQYTREKLSENPEEQKEARARHAAYFLALAETSHPELLRPGDSGETCTLQALAAEHDNLRAALRRGLESDRSLALRLAVALRTFWEVGGYLAEACDWLEAALARPGEHAPLRTRFAAHAAFGRFLLLRGRKDRAEEQFERALELSHASGHPRDMAEALNSLGLLTLERGDYARSQSFCEQALELHRSHGNTRGIAVTLNNLGNIARCQHQHAEAAAYYEESLALHRELGIRRSEAIALGNLGFVTWRRGELERAAKLLGHSIVIRRELDDEIGLAHSFIGVAGLMCAAQNYERAAMLLGTIDRLLKSTSVELARIDYEDYEHTATSTRARLAKAEFKRLWAEGRTLPLDRAIDASVELAGAVAP